MSTTFSTSQTEKIKKKKSKEHLEKKKNKSEDRSEKKQKQKDLNDLAEKKKKKSKKRAREEDEQATTSQSIVLSSQKTADGLESPTKKARLAPLPVHTKPSAPAQVEDVEMVQDEAVEPVLPSREGEDVSPLVFQTASLHVPLPPAGLKYANKAIQAEHFSPMLLVWQENLHGLVIAYDRVRLSESPFKIASEALEEESYTKVATEEDDDEDSDEEDMSEDGEKKESRVFRNASAVAVHFDAYTAPLIWASARFLLFRPQRGMKLEGWISLQNEGVIGMIVWNLFSASVGKSRIPKDWKWMEANEVNGVDNAVGEDPAINSHDDGYWLDKTGDRVKGTIVFWIVDFEVATSGPEGERGFISIEGTLLSEAEEKEAVEKEKQQEEQREKGIARRRR